MNFVKPSIAALSGSLLAALSTSLAREGAASEPPAEGKTNVQSAKTQWSASVRWENDTFAGTDRFYTDGVSLSLTHTGPNWLDPLADRLPWGEGRRTVGYDVMQAMFTPQDTHRDIPDPSDRPYTGILAFGLALHVEKENSYQGLKLESGIVGPLSGAEQAQRTVHSIIGSHKPQGWDYQLDNEPILDLAYEYRHKFHLAGQREHWSAEAFSLTGGWLGNVLTQGEIGGLLRAGYNMPNDFGPTLARGMGTCRRPAETNCRPRNPIGDFPFTEELSGTWCSVTSLWTETRSRAARVWTKNGFFRWRASEWLWETAGFRRRSRMSPGAKNSMGRKATASLAHSPLLTFFETQHRTLPVMSFTIQSIEAEQCVLLSYEGVMPAWELSAARYEADEVLDRRHWSRLLVDVTELQSDPTPVELYDFAKILFAAGRRTRVALVVRPEQARHAKLVEKYARTGRVFLSYFLDLDKARAWLTESRGRERTSLAPQTV